jgi:predicted DNA-binding transcriptional regulator AlpA
MAQREAMAMDVEVKAPDDEFTNDGVLIRALKAGALLRQKDVGRIINASERQVRAMRLRGEGPAHVRLGRLVRYRPRDVQAWIASATEINARAG